MLRMKGGECNVAQKPSLCSYAYILFDEFVQVHLSECKSLTALHLNGNELGYVRFCVRACVRACVRVHSEYLERWTD
jgi:hypothetical protein